MVVRNAAHFLRLLVIGGLLAVLSAACVEVTDDDVVATPDPAAVNVLGIWGAEELDFFEDMVAPWEQETGNRMAFTGTRAITSELTIRVEGGNPPDIAIPAEIGLFRDFARDGHLVPLSACPGLEETVRAEYPETYIELGSVDGELYGVFMKADTKGTIWYNPALFEEHGWEPLTEDSTFADLVALTEQIKADGVTPWSMGIESGEHSGWVGSDWIQQIILNEFDVELTDGLIDGTIEWTDDRVREAWEMWGEIALDPENTAQGGPTGINATNFVDATYPPFDDPPQAAMVYLSSAAVGFIQEQFPDAEAGVDFDFFPWPGGRVSGGANIVYAFNADDDTCSLMEWLASAESQQIWVDQGGFNSVNTTLDLAAYPDDVARALARQLTESEVFRFDLDDAIGGALQLAVFEGATIYLANPDQLDDILEQIEAARED